MKRKLCVTGLILVLAVFGGRWGWAQVATDETGGNGPPEVMAPASMTVAADGTIVAGAPIEGEAREWFTKIAQGGKTIWALLACSIIGLAFAMERLVMLRRSAIVPKGVATAAAELWEKGRHDALLELCARHPSTLSRILSFVVRHRGSSLADLSTTAGDIAARELRRHLLRAYPLAVIATVAPLLGLLGTVIGMIEAFDTVVLVGMGDATALAGGISKALITTMVGLSIAIPCLFAYHFFRSRTNLLAVILEEEVTELLAEWWMTEDGSHAH